MRRLALVLLVLVAVACKSAAPAPAVDAGIAKPNVAGTRTITLRQTSNAPGGPHDLVLELSREGADVKWVAKLTDRANAFGEPEPGGATACTCPVASGCACEDARGGEVVRKSGTVGPEAFDGFVSQLGMTAFGDAEAGTPDAVEGHVHVALAGATTRHLRRENEAGAWRFDGD